jgi:hypothetical protein
MLSSVFGIVSEHIRVYSEKILLKNWQISFASGVNSLYVVIKCWNGFYHKNIKGKHGVLSIPNSDFPIQYSLDMLSTVFGIVSEHIGVYRKKYFTKM